MAGIFIPTGVRFIYISLPLFFALTVVNSCTKDSGADPDTNNKISTATLQLNINYHCDNSPLILDTIFYTNNAGNKYGVSKIEFYLSNFILYGDSTEIKLSRAQYINADNSESNKLIINSIPKKTYHKISFNLGLDSVTNVTGGLENTVENNSMYWPEQMGGGYHFMKFEGHWSNSGTISGFAMHLGKNENLVEIELIHEIDLSEGNKEISLYMNLNEWFRNPEIYDFNVDGNYSMSQMPAMTKLGKNGWSVFEIK